MASRSSSRRCARRGAACSEQRLAAASVLWPTAAPTRDSGCCPRRARASTSGSGVALNDAVDRHLERAGPGSASTAAEISGADHAVQALEALREPRLPGVRPAARRSPATERYDVVICEQVIEHVDDPVAGRAQPAGAVRPGGHVIVSTPFLIRVHELPAYGMKDYWRFTPRGLRTLLEGGGLEVDEVGVVGQPPRAWPATSTAGPPTGAGTRCATSRTSRCRCGRSRATRAGSAARARPPPALRDRGGWAQPEARSISRARRPGGARVGGAGGGLLERLEAPGRCAPARQRASAGQVDQHAVARRSSSIASRTTGGGLSVT